MKTHCKRGHEKSGENVYIDGRGARQCRTCQRDRGRRWVRENRDRNRDALYQWKYGISLEDYELMSKTQGGVCALCGKPDPRRLVVDHDHDTQRVRGLLCTGCNSSLGKLGDTPAKLLVALEYVMGMDVNEFVLTEGKDALSSLLGLTNE